MATVMGRGAVTAVGRGRPGQARLSRLSITPYDLIIAVQDVVGPEDDGPVVATVWHLLRSGRLVGRVTGESRHPNAVPPRLPWESARAYSTGIL